MKKIIIFTFCIFGLSQLNAQTKITKINIIGKWTILAIDMPGMVYYNFEKDSLAIGETLKSQMPDPSQINAIKPMMKTQLSGFSKGSFLFNADGTAELNSGMEGPQTSTYTVDEEKSEITAFEKNLQQTVFKADFLKENLRLYIKTPQGDMLMVLKKSK